MAEAASLLDGLLVFSQASVARQNIFQSAYFGCMKNAGFDIPASARPPVLAPSAEQSGFFDNEFESRQRGDVEANGYAPSGEGIAIENLGELDTGFEDWFAGLSSAEKERFHLADMGDGTTETVRYGNIGTTFRTSGCNFEALNAEWFDARRYNRLLTQANSLRSDIYAESKSDKGYAETVKLWRKCLTSDGFKAAKWPGDMPETEEQAKDIVLAIADFDCRRGVNLSRAWNDAVVQAVSQKQSELKATADEMRSLLADS